MKKKREWKGFLAGFIAAVLLLNTAVPALGATIRQLKATFNNTKITLDGKQVVPKDANGKTIEPFIVDGTTYLPIRGIASALGLDVGWEDQTKTVILTSKTHVATPEPDTGTVSYEITYQNCHLRQSQYSNEVLYTAIVEVQNTGTADLYLDEAIFDFEDRNGMLLATDSFVSTACDIIAPGEKGYFFRSGFVTGKLTPSTDYIFKPKISVEKSKLSIVRYDISNVTMKIEDDTRLSLIGKVTNHTTEDAVLPNIKIVLYRADGTPILAEHRNISTLKAGDTTSFDTHDIDLGDMGATVADVASYKIFSCKTQWQF